MRGVFAMLVALGLLACEEGAGPSTAVDWPTPRGPGAVLYLTYCESCHGVGGEGNGPAAASLRTPPTDLTRLWERYGTPLQRDALADYIDGRLLANAHGPREMPIWGAEFFEDVPSETPNLEALRRRLIGLLVEHLQSLQSEQPT